MFGKTEGVGLRQGSAAIACSRACFAAEDRAFSPLRSLQSMWVSCCSCPCFQKGEWRHGLEGTCLPLQVELGVVIPLPTYSLHRLLNILSTNCIVFTAKYYGRVIVDEDFCVCDSFRLAFGSMSEVEGSGT